MLLPRCCSGTWRCRRAWQLSSTAISTGSGSSSMRCSPRPRFAASSSGREPSPIRSIATLPRSTRNVASLRMSSCGSSPRARRAEAVRPTCRTRSGTRWSGSSCTSASVHWLVRNCTSRSAAHWNGSAQQACPSAPAELATHFERGREPMTALRYYAEAAQAALLHLSPAECMTLSERGLSLLDQAPAGIERHALEITLATLEGASADHLFGVASSEAKSAFQRAYSRLAEVPQHPMRDSSCTVSASCFACAPSTTRR